MNAEADPPDAPTSRTVTAGLEVGVVAELYRVATTWVSPATPHRSAVPWNCMVSPTMPRPGALLVSTAR